MNTHRKENINNSKPKKKNQTMSRFENFTPDLTNCPSHIDEMRDGLRFIIIGASCKEPKRHAIVEEIDELLMSLKSKGILLYQGGLLTNDRSGKSEYERRKQSNSLYDVLAIQLVSTCLQNNYNSSIALRSELPFISYFMLCLVGYYRHSKSAVRKY